MVATLALFGGLRGAYGGRAYGGRAYVGTESGDAHGRGGAAAGEDR